MSDPHLPPPKESFRWDDVVSKRLLSRFAWLRKHKRHSKPVLDAITSDIRGHAVDHLVITGDLTNFSTPGELAAARAWLTRLGDPTTITVSPGNHDALIADGGPPDFAPWRPWLGDESRTDFPFVRVQGPVAILNLSTARPTGSLLAQGVLGAPQIERAESLLRELGTGGLYRIVLLHHPLTEGLVSRRKSLMDGQALRDAMRRAGAELVLHGHAHEAHLTAIQGPLHDIPVLAVPSASTPAGRRQDQAARWNLLEIQKDGGAFRTRVTAREITADLSVATTGQFVLGQSLSGSDGFP